MVRIRMTRMGRPHRPFYRINAVDARSKRDGRFIETLGWYNPVEQNPERQLHVNTERVKYWLSVGAQPSDTVNDLLAKLEVIDASAWHAKREKRLGKKKAAAAAAAAATAASAEGESAPAENA